MPRLWKCGIFSGNCSIIEPKKCSENEDTTNQSKWSGLKKKRLLPSQSTLVTHLNNSNFKNENTMNQTTPWQRPGTSESALFKHIKCSDLANVDIINWNTLLTCSNCSYKFLHFNIQKAEKHCGIYISVTFQRHKYRYGNQYLFETPWLPTLFS